MRSVRLVGLGAEPVLQKANDFKQPVREPSGIWLQAAVLSAETFEVAVHSMSHSILHAAL